MADPISLLVMAANFTTIVGAVGEAVSAKSAGKANAQIATDNARTVENQAAQQALDIKNEGNRLEGSQIAAAGASGVTLEGSPVSVILDSAVQTELDARRAIYDGQVQAVGYRNQASAAKLAGSQGFAAGLLKAVTPALKGAQLVSGLASGGQINPNGFGLKIPPAKAVDTSYAKPNFAGIY